MKQWDIYLVNFEPAIGSEIQKMRPGIIVQSDEIDSSLVSIMPLSSKVSKKGDNDIVISKTNANRLLSDSIIKTSQISSFDRRRLIHYIGKTSKLVQLQVKQYLKKHFSI